MAVAGSGDICGGGEVCGVSSAREPRTEDMTAVASTVVGAGGVEDVARAGVATSDTGVDWGGGGVEATTIVVSVRVVGGVEVGAEAVAEAAAEAALSSSDKICASTIC